jgi:hypothetical protein
MFDVFWWCSAIARMDTRDSFSLIWERFPDHGQTGTRQGIIPPEETTTFNLVRRLAYWQDRRGGPYAATLHSKALEGGTKRTPASGADLEMAVEVAPNVWVDLLLQAKRMYESGSGEGAYVEWKYGQLQKLRRWAAANDRTPGILLYNAAIPPFGNPQTKVSLGACCRARVRCYGRMWPEWTSPNDKSPLAITLVILPDRGEALPPDLRNDSLLTGIANKYASPLECIFCPGRVAGLAKMAGEELSKRASLIPSQGYIPRWAAEFLGETRQSISDDPAGRSSNYSLVLPFIGDPGDEGDQKDG